MYRDVPVYGVEESLLRPLTSTARHIKFWGEANHTNLASTNLRPSIEGEYIIGTSLEYNGMYNQQHDLVGCV